MVGSVTVEQPEVAPTVVPWAAPADVPASVVSAVSAETLAAALGSASTILWHLTGRRWAGVRGATVAVMPRRCRCNPWSSVETHGLADAFVGIGVVRHDSWCPTDDLRLVLPDYPVQSVTAVVAPDETYGPVNLRIHDGRTVALVDDDGFERHWPHRRYIVTYTHGSPPPIEGRRYAALYAAQLALAATPGAKDCKLPTRVQTVTRQNVTLAMLDPFEFLDKGRTGLVDVDTWIAAVNPYALKSRPKVWSPDVDRQRVEYRRP